MKQYKPSSSNNSSSLKSFRSKKGSALMTVLIVGMGLLLVVGITLRWGLTEKKLNTRHVLRQQAKNAAESMVEYGFAELIARFTEQTSFPLTELQSNPLTQPTTYTSFFSDSNISTDTADTYLQGGQIPPGEWKYIDPKDPANETDPLRGKRVFVREVVVYGKATAKSSGFGGDITSYTMQKLQVRDAPLLSHAIFYNMDLEMHSGSTMDISGPIHSNTDIWMECNQSGPLTLHEGVTAAGHIYHGYKQTNTVQKTGDLWIKDSGGTKRNMYDGGSRSSNSSWLDSRDPDWRAKASQRWDGAVQDSAHQVPTLNPLGISDYVPDDPTTSANERENHAYSIIEPVLSTSHPDYKGSDNRSQKFAYKAGLLLKVTEATSGSRFEVTGYTYERTNPDNPLSPPVLDSNGDPVLKELQIPAQLIGGANADMDGIEASEDMQEEAYYRTGGNVYGGMYDHRNDIAMDVISIDVGKLKDKIESDSASDWSSSGASEYQPEKWWNGVVYVEFPIESSSGGRTDKIVKGKYDDVALHVINGKNIPDPYANNTNFVSERGMTLATNQPMYVVGHFNADGNLESDAATALDNDNYTTGWEPPAALVADTITVLSTNWKNNRKYSDDSVNSSNRPAPSHGEISAALITGITPTVPLAEGGDGSTSGGVHNFPRFLEYWSPSNDTFTIRGSLVSLFESEVHDAPRPSNYTHYYYWPARNFGFNDNFRNGIYPPGAPNARTFRRVAFKDMTEAEYNDAINNLWTAP